MESACRYKSENTKLPELGFHAVLGDGACEVRVEQAVE
jgi:hypothetical protein